MRYAELLESFPLPTDDVAGLVKNLVAELGLKVVRDSQSAKSVSRYLTIDLPRECFMAGKSARRNFCKIAKIAWPEMGLTFNVRISDHRGYGEGTRVDYTISLNAPIEPQIERLRNILILFPGVSS